MGAQLSEHRGELRFVRVRSPVFRGRGASQVEVYLHEEKEQPQSCLCFLVEGGLLFSVRLLVDVPQPLWQPVGENVFVQHLLFHSSSGDVFSLTVCSNVVFYLVSGGAWRHKGGGKTGFAFGIPLTKVFDL